MSPLLRLEGFEGPLDLLLDLARSQKLDLARISILTLVDQYLEVVSRSGVTNLEQEADWLVMAAWLAWLKSRLLLPDDPVAVEDGAVAAAALQLRLLELARAGLAAEWLVARPQTGRDRFRRGAAESLARIDRSGWSVDIGQLLGAYMAVGRRRGGRRFYRPTARRFWTMQAAMERLRSLLGPATPDWRELAGFLPEPDADPAAQRAAVAGTLLAGLELARSGAVELRQDAPFAPILLRQVAQ